MNDGIAQLNGARPTWTPESPFLFDPGTQAPAQPTTTRESPFVNESPFVSEFESAADAAGQSPRGEAFGELLESLRDEEFGELLARVADEASAIAESPAYEGEDSSRQRLRQSNAAAAYLEGIAERADAALQELESLTDGKDLMGFTEAGLQEYLDSLPTSESEDGPAAEQFLGKLLKKAKSAVSGAVRLARRGLSVAGNLLPHTFILKQIRKLVPSLLKRVLRLAIDKLPVSIQPIARQLAARIFGSSAAAPEAEGESGSYEMTTADARLLAGEFDTMVAGFTVEGEAFGQRLHVETMLEDREAQGSRNALRDLDRARDVFVAQLAQTADGEDPTPAVEQFVPAVLAGLKLGVRIIGRPKIVRFLSGHLARLIQPYIGQANANRLSSALVDAGLKLVHLEAESESAANSRLASETLASTVEDAVSQLAQTLPAEEWESEALLEAYTRDALEKAVAANFPDDTVRGELHEANEVKGVWRRPRGHRYKKYTRTPSVMLTPQVAQAIPSFRGVPLKNILRDRFGIVGPVRVHIHLYEAVAGTTPGAIQRGEMVPGGPESSAATPSAPAAAASDGGAAAPAPAEEFHPLTEAVAGLLLREPGLGRNVDERFLETPNSLAVGQRLYRVSVEGARPRGPNMKRTRSVRARFNLKRGEVVVRLYLSEAAAQELATALRRKAPAGVVLNRLRQTLEARVSAQGEAPADAMQLSADSSMGESEGASRQLHHRLGRTLRHKLRRSVVRAIAEQLDRRYAQFASDIDGAANANVDGLTIRITLRGVPWLAAVRRVARVGAAMREDEATTATSVAASTVDVIPGYDA